MSKKQLAYRVPPGTNVRLSDYDPADTVAVTKQEARQQLAVLTDELRTLQTLLYAASHQSVLIVLQGMDAGGKDGTISYVFSSMNPQGCDAVSFKQPTANDLAHDFLWRIHAYAPPKGKIAIFNRSHYEDVLIVRVHNLVPPHIWKQRYEQINQFESLLAANGTIILKFFLHISKGEQEERLLERERDRDKAWKIDANDWAEREYWDAYQNAYADALTKCSTKESPWYIVPADHKWFRNLAVSEAIVTALRPYRKEWQQALESRGEEQLAQLHHLRAQQTAAPT